jgi:chromatin segregation and condensation protein Rec8/ScpA/Scc1 (kleisin family)
LIKGVGRLEAVRTFILLLFLAQNGKVNLWQNEETEEVYITINLNSLESKQSQQNQEN